MLLYFLKHLRRRQSQNDLKEDIVCNQTIAGLLFCLYICTIVLYILWKSTGANNCLAAHILQMCSLMSHRRKKSNADLEQQVGE